MILFRCLDLSSVQIILIYFRLTVKEVLTILLYINYSRVLITVGNHCHFLSFFISVHLSFLLSSSFLPSFLPSVHVLLFFPPFFFSFLLSLFLHFFPSYLLSFFHHFVPSVCQSVCQPDRLPFFLRSLGLSFLPFFFFFLISFLLSLSTFLFYFGILACTLPSEALFVLLDKKP